MLYRAKQELKELQAMNNDAQIARDTAKSELEKQERQVYEERKKREMELAEALADLRGGVRDARPPWESKFFRFHAVFGKIWRVHAPPGGFTPPLGKILDPPL